MEKIKYLSNNNHSETAVLRRLGEENAQEDLDEKKRQNKRTEKWDTLLFNCVPLIILLFVLVLFGIINFSPSVEYFIGAGGLTSIITAIFRLIKRRDSS